MMQISFTVTIVLLLKIGLISRIVNVFLTFLHTLRTKRTSFDILIRNENVMLVT